MRVFFAESSKNRKVGSLPISYSSKATCPESCELRGNGCYSWTGPSSIQWKKAESITTSISWEEFLEKVRKIEKGRLWRHNVGGDMAGEDGQLDIALLEGLVRANKGRRGFTYTHALSGPEAPSQQVLDAVRRANANRFTTNLSANNLTQADEFMALAVGPVVTLLPADVKAAPQHTPAGHRVVVCPAVTHGKTCLECRLCAVPDRKVCVGFPAHSSRKRAVDKVFFAVDISKPGK